MLPRVQSRSGRGPVLRPPSSSRNGRDREDRRRPLPPLGRTANTASGRITPVPTNIAKTKATVKDAAPVDPNIPPASAALEQATALPAEAGFETTVASDTTNPGPPTSDVAGPELSILAASSDMPAREEEHVKEMDTPELSINETVVAAERVDPALLNGKVRIIYEQYDELFDISDGSLAQADIDEVYCLSFVMPGCRIHLSELNPSDRTRRANEGLPVSYEKEDPEGVYRELMTSKTYFAYVEQEEERLLRDQAETKARLQSNDNVPAASDRGGRDQFYESCSCLFGNPCVDEYVCKDWNNRYAVAAHHGWKGF